MCRKLSMILVFILKVCSTCKILMPSHPQSEGQTRLMRRGIAVVLLLAFLRNMLLGGAFKRILRVTVRIQFGSCEGEWYILLGAMQSTLIPFPD
jgi:hypothetical protein